MNIENNSEMISLIRNFTNIQSSVSISQNNYYSYIQNKEISGHEAIISPDNRWIITVGGSGLSDGKINIYDIMDSSLLRAFALPYGTYIDSLSMSNDGRIIAVGDGEKYDYSKHTSIGNIMLYDVLTGRKVGDVQTYGTGTSCLCLFNPVYTSLLLVAFGNGVYIFDLSTGKERYIRLNTWRDFIETIEYSYDGSYIAVGDYSGNITILDGLTLRILKKFSGHSEAIRSLSFSPDNSILISGSDDFTIGVWNMANGNEIFTLTDHLGKINSVLYTMNGLYFLSSSEDGTTKLWDSHSFKVLKNYKNSAEITLSPDGNYFINTFGELFKIE
jgi:WD40 repeat protein